MATFHLQIVTDNAAFDESGPTQEVARILREAAERVKREPRPLFGETKLRDINGNTVGFYEWREI